MDYLKRIIFFLILSTLIDQLFGQSMYRPYIRLITGFMLISLLLQPMTNIFLNEDLVTSTLSSAVDQKIDPTFRDDVTKEQEKKIKEQITNLLSSDNVKIDDVIVKINESGRLQQITIKGKEIKNKKKLKIMISNFYNMKESNINISE